MNVESEIASAELHRLTAALLPGLQVTSASAVQLFDLSRFILSSSIIRETLTELVDEEQSSAQDAAHRWFAQRSAPVRASLKGFSRIVMLMHAANEQDVRTLRDPQSRHQDKAAQYDQAAKVLGEDPLGRLFVGPTPWHLLEGSSFDKVDAEGLEKAGKLLWHVQQMSSALLEAGVEAMSARIVFDSSHEVARDLEAVVTDYNLTRDTLARLPLKATWTHLKTFHETMKNRLEGRFDPASDLHLRDAIVPLSGSDGLVRLISAVQTRLGSMGAQRHVLRRLSSYFEHFRRDELVRMVDAELEKRAAAQLERVVQREMDAFLFVEGLFPITHAEASGGAIDTLLASETRAVLDEAKRADVVPTLIEVKQLLRSEEATRSAVIRKVREARGQAEQYRNHVRSEYKLRATQAFVVLFYGGKKRFALEKDDGRTFLIYVGKTRPSESAPPITEAELTKA